MGIIDKVVDKNEAGQTRNPNGDVNKNFAKQGADAHTKYRVKSSVDTDRAYRPERNTVLTRGTSKRITIDMERLRMKGILTPDSIEQTIAADFRNIKRPLLKNAFRKDAVEVERGNLILVTSSLPGEGKTYTSVNLAISIAMELDKTVLLVDADVLRPSIATLFGAKAESGLTDLLLEDKPDLSRYLIKTNIPTLTLLPAGTRHQLSTELLGSVAMTQLTGELASRYSDRVVIFDSPPLLAATESSVLAGLMGQIVVVVEAEKTTQSTLNKTLSMLDSDAAISLVLNKDRRRLWSGYSYGYY